MEDDDIVKSHVYYIHPYDWQHSKTLSPEAFAVHGITKEFCEENGIRLSEAMIHCLKDMQMVDTIVGHNLAFDMKLLMASFWRVGLGHIANSMLRDKTYVCTRRGLDKNLKCSIKCSFPEENTDGTRLTLLYKFLFEDDYGNAHDALSDVYATMKCYFELMNRGFNWCPAVLCRRSYGEQPAC
jgi:DNA polymerase III epsilon subunit-like protein